MAVIKVLFKLEGKETEVIDMSYSFDQNVDNIGQPAGEVRGGIVNLTLGTEKDKTRFSWAINSDMKKDADIDFIDSKGQLLKTIKLVDAYCVGYTEDYTAFDGQEAGNVTIKDGAKEHLTLSCKDES